MALWFTRKRNDESIRLFGRYVRDWATLRGFEAGTRGDSSMNYCDTRLVRQRVDECGQSFATGRVNFAGPAVRRVASRSNQRKSRMGVAPRLKFLLAPARGCASIHARRDSAQCRRFVAAVISSACRNTADCRLDRSPQIRAVPTFDRLAQCESESQGGASCPVPGCGISGTAHRRRRRTRG